MLKTATIILQYINDNIETFVTIQQLHEKLTVIYPELKYHTLLYNVKNLISQNKIKCQYCRVNEKQKSQYTIKRKRK